MGEVGGLSALSAQVSERLCWIKTYKRIGVNLDGVRKRYNDEQKPNESLCQEMIRFFIKAVMSSGKGAYEG
jgi:DNA-binding transcriptional MerR regulator